MILSPLSTRTEQCRYEFTLARLRSHWTKMAHRAEHNRRKVIRAFRKEVNRRALPTNRQARIAQLVSEQRHRNWLAYVNEYILGEYVPGPHHVPHQVACIVVARYGW